MIIIADIGVGPAIEIEITKYDTESIIHIKNLQGVADKLSVLVGI